MGIGRFVEYKEILAQGRLSVDRQSPLSPFVGSFSDEVEQD